MCTVQYNDWLNEEVDNMAREGLRTLVVAKKTLSEESYADFEQRFSAAKLSVVNRSAQVFSVVNRSAQVFSVVNRSAQVFSVVNRSPRYSA
jgi:hypothetical protein